MASLRRSADWNINGDRLAVLIQSRHVIVHVRMAHGSATDGRIAVTQEIAATRNAELIFANLDKEGDCGPILLIERLGIVPVLLAYNK